MFKILETDDKARKVDFFYNYFLKNFNFLNKENIGLLLEGIIKKFASSTDGKDLLDYILQKKMNELFDLLKVKLYFMFCLIFLLRIIFC